jgi:hypothetical protein
MQMTFSERGDGTGRKREMAESVIEYDQLIRAYGTENYRIIVSYDEDISLLECEPFLHA